jgi:TolB protein
MLLLQMCQEQAPIKVRDFTKIVFLSNREAPQGKQHIFKINPDGGNPLNLTPELKSINTLSQPKLSPDGKKVLFRSFSDKTRLELLDMETLQLSTVTELDYRGDIQSSLSPRGDKIVFVTKINNLNQIHIIGLDGTGKQNISDPEREEKDPDFSADGAKIICSSKHMGMYYLIMMNQDGAKRVELLKQKDEIRFPTLSPDGQYIAYIAYDSEIPGLYRINTDGSNLGLLTKKNVVVSKPKITPDASKIVFLNRERGRKFTDICLIKDNGTDLKNLTPSLNIFNQLPQLTPDGKSVVFQSIKFKDCEIYRVDLDGTNLVNLTNHPKWDQFPSL